MGEPAMSNLFRRPWVFAILIFTLAFPLAAQAVVDNTTCTVTPIGHAEAAFRLYPNILNALAHQNEGLDAARRLTEHVRCFRVNGGPLRSTCDMIARIVRERD